MIIAFGLVLLLSLYCRLHSWGTKADCVHLCLAGSDCLPLSYCSKDPWDISLCSSHWQVSQCVFNSDLCWGFLVFNNYVFSPPVQHRSTLMSSSGTWSLSWVSRPSLPLIKLWCWTSPCAAQTLIPCPTASSMYVHYVQLSQTCVFRSYLMWTNYCYLLCPVFQLFLEMVPRFLGMSPLVEEGEVTAEVNGVRERRRSSFGLMQRAEEYVLKQPRSEMMFDKQRERHGLTRSVGKTYIFKTF